MPVGGAGNEPKRQCSSHQEMSFLHDEGDSSQEEDKDEGVPVSTSLENTLGF